MAKKNTPPALMGYDGMEADFQLDTGRTVTAAELVTAASVLYHSENSGLDVSQLPLAWNALEDTERNGYCVRAFDAMDKAASDAARLDETRAVATVYSTPAERKLGDALLEVTLNALRNLSRPWAQMTEDQQDEMLESITNQARNAAAATVRMLATRNTHHVLASLDQVTIKKGAKLQLSVKNEAIDQDLLDSVGETVIIVLAGELKAAEEIQQPMADPQQHSLGIDNGVQHSDPED